jgi:hypothetical protein
VYISAAFCGYSYLVALV